MCPEVRLPSVIGSLKNERYPPDLTFCVQQFQPWKSSQNSRMKIVDHRRGTVGEDHDCRNHLRRIVRSNQCLSSGADMHGYHRLRFVAGSEEWVPVSGPNTREIEPCRE